MKEKLRIFIACGSGVATSTVAAERVKEICAREKISAEVVKGQMTDVAIAAKNYDIILTASNFRGELEVPCLSVIAFISGIKEEETEAKLVQLLHICIEK